MPGLYSSSQIVNIRRNSSSMVDPMASQSATEIAAPDTIAVGDRNTRGAGELVAAMINTNQNNLLRNDYWINQLSAGINSSGLSSVEHRNIHPFANHFSNGLNNVDSSAITHRRMCVSVDQSSPYNDNVLNMDDSGQLLSPSTFSAPSATEALALLLQGLRSNTDAVLSSSQLLQTVPPQVSADLSQLMMNHDSMGLVQQILQNTQSQDVISRPQSDRSNQAQLRSILNSVALSAALQAQEENTETSFNPLVRMLSSGGTVQELRETPRYQWQNVDALRDILPRNNDSQQQIRREIMFQSLQSTSTDEVHTATSIADNRIIGNSNTASNDSNNIGDDRGPQAADPGENNRNNAGLMGQQDESVASPTTSELFTMANHALEMYRSNS